MERLDKILSHVGRGSRKDVREIIRKGLVKVDEEVVCDPGFKVDPEKNVIEIDGDILTYNRFVYYMLNKPQGYITATDDNFHKTVLELINPRDWRKDLFPVGRLDKDTEGLLILTNDGNLGHMLTSPKYQVPKVYYFETLEEMTKDSLDQLCQGVDLGDFYATALNVKIIDKNKGQLVIDEGKFHQVKRMCAAIGYTIVYLERIEFGPLKLDPSLPRGDYRPLTAEEVALLKEAVL